MYVYIYMYIYICIQLPEATPPPCLYPLAKHGFNDSLSTIIYPTAKGNPATVPVLFG